MRAHHYPESHLDRVRDHLRSGDPMALFYAALEFRYCVESRLLDYAEHAERFAKKKGNPWSARELSRLVDGVFGHPSNIYQIEMCSERFPDPVTVEYVPVTAEVRSTLGRLDNFLHYPGVLQCFNEGKDGILRSLLEEGVSQMERCLSGGLQGSLIMDASGHVHMTINLSKDPELERSIKNGDHLRLRVEVTPFLDNEEGEQGVTPNS